MFPFLFLALFKSRLLRVRCAWQREVDNTSELMMKSCWSRRIKNVRLFTSPLVLSYLILSYLISSSLLFSYLLSSYLPLFHVILIHLVTSYLYTSCALHSEEKEFEECESGQLQCGVRNAWSHSRSKCNKGELEEEEGEEEEEETVGAADITSDQKNTKFCRLSINCHFVTFSLLSIGCHLTHNPEILSRKDAEHISPHLIISHYTAPHRNM